MKLFRICKEKYKDTLSGYGASLFGGRWNSKGVELIYTAESRALASYEVSVHVPLSLLSKDYFMIEIEVSDSVVIEVLDEAKFPFGWDNHPVHQNSQLIGDSFVRECKSLILKVPSVVVKGDYNYLINERHSDFSKIKIVKSYHFPFDESIMQVNGKR